MVHLDPVHEVLIPGDATRREYAVYLRLATEHESGRVVGIYVGKTGDNREGCNPIISRVGNHMSFNPLHAQTRNRIKNTEAFDYRMLYVFFGSYVEPGTSRAGIDLVNEMERRLNRRAQEEFGTLGAGGLVENPWKGTRRPPMVERERRAALSNPARLAKLDALIGRASELVRSSEDQRRSEG